MIMFHPGFPAEWALMIGIVMILLSLWAMVIPLPASVAERGVSVGISLTRIPIIGGIFRYLSRYTWPLLLLKVTFASLFVLILLAGLWGTPIIERNLATALTWNLWWTGIVIAVLVSGTAWCAVCPWDNIASWLVNHRLWHRSGSNSRLNLRVPHFLRSVWPASLLFIGFTWLELGIGIVASPYETALLALAMVILATTALALFEGKAFCRYMCPVGRTVGAYSQLSAVALRPINSEICKDCKTLECYHGSDNIAPCPTKQIMGRLQENTYCTSCGNCTQSCPAQNISWQLRSPSSEAIKEARSHVDEAFFMLFLLALTIFHGVTMLDGWQRYLSQIAQTSILLNIDEQSRQLISFSAGLMLCLLVPILFYGFCIWLIQNLNADNAALSFKKLFLGFAFVALPLAFAYHIAHNLNHLIRESGDWMALLVNPFGIDAQPLSMMEKHLRHMVIMLPENVLFVLQGLIMIGGFIIAVQVIRYRARQLFAVSGSQLFPLLLFAAGVTGFNLWLLVQPMVMRM